jgi:hypothetical protein
MLMLGMLVAALSSAGATAVLVLVVRFGWRRGKPLQEP